MWYEYQRVSPILAFSHNPYFDYNSKEIELDNQDLIEHGNTNQSGNDQIIWSNSEVKTQDFRVNFVTLRSN